MENIIDKIDSIPENDKVILSQQSKYTIYKGKIAEFKKILKFIPEELVQKWYDESKILNLAKDVRNTIEYGFGIFPRVCSDVCEIKEACPFYRTDILPENYPCPLESYISTELDKALQEELSVDRDITISDKITISQIVMLQIITGFRLNALLSINGVQTKGTIKTPQGIVETQVTSPIINAMGEISDKIQGLMKNLHLHRLDRSKYRLAPADTKKDMSVQELKDKLIAAGIDPDKVIKAIYQ